MPAGVDRLNLNMKDFMVLLEAGWQASTLNKSQDSLT
jgi:hypothetical protein